MTRPILFVVDYDPQRAALVPRAMTVLGLIGGPLLFASGIAVLFGRESGILTARALTKLIILVYSLIILAKRCGCSAGRNKTMKRTDVVLAVGMLATVLSALVALAATGSVDGFLSWVWARHHNELSWYVRPLFLLPFCFFASRRSLSGMVVTLLVFPTSLFWFPAPENPSARGRIWLGNASSYSRAASSPGLRW